ncbi:hypothetical protein HYH03_001384 [Edaphochlamys debaryana]|uniref:Uncharacterized protein n=1 Tax=Edaphochlamys debaryana TaxID=47281 RepID=A0A835YF79_9CHLO|nr:hypothetical protein HYH03_001384 [Edaphochlamys debaryana]|eukprot:KAG2500617.1 hypothetical protein HYH03_001384 [Edaphochlamys debaryana]
MPPRALLLTLCLAAVALGAWSGLGMGLRAGATPTQADPLAGPGGAPHTSSANANAQAQPNPQTHAQSHGVHHHHNSAQVESKVQQQIPVTAQAAVSTTGSASTATEGPRARQRQLEGADVTGAAGATAGSSLAAAAAAGADGASSSRRPLGRAAQGAGASSVTEAPAGGDGGGKTASRKPAQAQAQQQSQSSSAPAPAPLSAERLEQRRLWSVADLPPVQVPPYGQFSYDVALSSGFRSQYGATFASTLAGLLASGCLAPPGGPARLHLLLSDARLLNVSLVHNLAHMASRVRVSVYDMQGASASMRARNTFYQLLHSPDFVPGKAPAAPDATNSTPTSGSKARRKGPQQAQIQAQAQAQSLSPEVSDPGGMGMRPLGRVAVPTGSSQLPALLLEDDVWLADDFPRKMHHVARDAARRSGNRPFVIKLYINSGKPLPVADVRAQAAACNASRTAWRLGPRPYSPGAGPGPGAAVLLLPDDPPGGSGAAAGAAATGEGEGAGRGVDGQTSGQAPGRAVGAAAAGAGASDGGAGKGETDGGGGGEDPALRGYRAKPRAYRWGAQGLYLSDGRLRRRLAECFYQYTQKKYERQRRYKDWPLKMCLEDMGVAAYDSGASLVQHIGASSSLFGAAAANSRYHRACAFPFVEKVPAQDAREDWL